jgi:hypothetical protein
MRKRKSRKGFVRQYGWLGVCGVIQLEEVIQHEPSVEC